MRFTAASTPTARRGTGLVRVAGRGAARPADSSVDIGFWAVLLSSGWHGFGVVLSTFSSACDQASNKLESGGQQFGMELS